MDDMPEQDRAALVALLDQALRDETRTEPPPETEQGEWLYADTELSQPDANGWMTRVPIEPRWSCARWWPGRSWPGEAGCPTGSGRSTPAIC